MSVIHEERGITINLRLLIFPAVVLVALGLFLLRLWMLQIVESEELQRRAERSRLTTISLSAPRGLIVDRKGVPVAAVRSQYVVTGIPKVVHADPNVLDRVAALLGTSREALLNKLNDGNWRPNLPTAIFEGATSEQATRIVEDFTLTGIGVTTQPTRSYREPMLMSHVLGYVRAPDEKDVTRFKDHGLNAPEYVGKIGLEYTHDIHLSGQAGVEELTIDSRSKPLRTQEMINPKPGSKLVLGIDLELQRYAYELLGDRTGSVVAIEPSTGLVLCYISKPSYDANLWLKGLSQAEYQSMLASPGKPLINRPVQTGYMPGSTFKIVTAFASVLAGKFNPNRTVFCPGYYSLGRKRVRCLGTHGSISFHRAFEKSCNTYFVEAGMGAKEENLRRASEILGLGSKTGIDITSEKAGNIPSREWKSERAAGLKRSLDRMTGLTPAERKRREAAIKAETNWVPGDTANFSIGQGYVLVTPMQLACMTAMVANHGTMYRPHFVRERIDVDGSRVPFAPEVIHEYDGAEDFWRILEVAMGAVVQSGTARSAQVPGLIWGGKTGSAQNSRGQKADSLYVGFAPLKNPKIAIAVVVENGGHGGELAAPVAGKIVERYLYGAPKAPVADSSRVASASSSAFPVPATR